MTTYVHAQTTLAELDLLLSARGANLTIDISANIVRRCVAHLTTPGPCAVGSGKLLHEAIDDAFARLDALRGNVLLKGAAGRSGAGDGP